MTVFQLWLLAHDNTHDNKWIQYAIYTRVGTSRKSIIHVYYIYMYWCRKVTYPKQVGFRYTITNLNASPWISSWYYCGTVDTCYALVHNIHGPSEPADLALELSTSESLPSTCGGSLSMSNCNCTRGKNEHEMFKIIFSGLPLVRHSNVTQQTMPGLADINSHSVI